MIRNQYNDIAPFYDMLSEGDDGMIWFRHYLEATLKILPENAKVLDCSCGTGGHAIWLAQQGFEVHASDISEGMLEAAKKKAVKEDQAINFFKSSWEELPEKCNARFDLVVCPGNSLSHLIRLEHLDEVFGVIKNILKSGGLFFFDIRNWEKTYEENTLEDQEFQVNGDGGIYDVKYSYEIPPWNETGHMHVDIRHDTESEFIRFTFDFLPLGYHQYHDAAIKAGFENIERGFFPNSDYYFIKTT